MGWKYGSNSEVILFLVIRNPLSFTCVMHSYTRNSRDTEGAPNTWHASLFPSWGRKAYGSGRHGLPLQDCPLCVKCISTCLLCLDSSVPLISPLLRLYNHLNFFPSDICFLLISNRWTLPRLCSLFWAMLSIYFLIYSPVSRLSGYTLTIRLPHLSSACTWVFLHHANPPSPARPAHPALLSP